MLYLLIALKLAYISTTHYALRTGIGYEGNPVLLAIKVALHLCQLPGC